jgi:hypothetical protein
MTVRSKALLTLIASAAVAIGLEATGAIGKTDPGGLVQRPNLHRDLSLKSCSASFDHYYLGTPFQGRPLVKTLDVCDQPDPVLTRSAKGRIVDPDSMMRPHFTSAIYGTCDPSGSDVGCHPPLEVQTWPACERSPADYTFGEPEAPVVLAPSQIFQVRGVTARFYGSDRLELSTGDVTVVLFGTSQQLLVSAAKAIRTSSDSPDSVPAGQALPPPVPGAESGTLPC